MEDTMLELVKICQEKEFLCIHDDIDDLIESALNSKLLLINSNSQRLEKKEQEVKNVVEQPAEREKQQPAEREKRNIQSLQNFIVVPKSSISSNTSQISSIHAIAPILSTKEPEHLLSMRYEHLSITPETESDEVTESNVENLLPIPSECEIFFDSNNNDDISSDDESFEDIEYIDASLPDPEIVSVEEENVVQQEEEEVDFEDISQIQDVVLHEKHLSITRLISNIESLNVNSTLDHVFNSFESDNSLLDIFSPKFKTFCDHSKETRSGNTTHANDSLLEYDSFFFEIEPDQERLINLVKNNIFDDLSSNSLLEEDNLSIPRPPPEPPDAQTDAGEETLVMMNNKDNDVYSYFIFIIFYKMLSLLSAESEDTIFDPVANYCIKNGAAAGDMRHSYFPPANTIPRHSRRKNTSIVESEIRTNATMADNRTMAQMLQAPIEGYEDAIVVPPINANNFELK
uniref:Reverse transcriptase domain-containing protein n=1 Tax=Tanacetum cinerariifolium TaxID=118510 RepID=A0A6L2JUA2_TANCI|nr:hypothetical protein [Tanacetum cinerariifolium]